MALRIALCVVDLVSPAQVLTYVLCKCVLVESVCGLVVYELCVYSMSCVVLPWLPGWVPSVLLSRLFRLSVLIFDCALCRPFRCCSRSSL